MAELRRTIAPLALVLAALVAPSGARASTPESLVALGAVEVEPSMAADLATLPSITPYAAFAHFRRDDPAGNRALLEDHGLEVVGDFQATNALFAVGLLAEFRSLTLDPSVTYLEPDRALQYSGDTGPWATRSRVAQEAVAGGPYRDATGRILDGSGVGVAVIDSGVDGTHADLRNRMGRNFKLVCSAVVFVNANTNRCFGPVTVQTELPAQSNSDTTGGHGTHVAGIVAGDGATSTVAYDPAAAPNVKGTFTGAAPGATLYGFGAGEVLFVSAAAEAFEYIYANYDTFTPRIRVINNSWGDTGGTAYKPASVVSQMVEKLVEEKGVTVVFAAGNSGGTGSADMTSSHAKDPTPGVISAANYWDRAAGGYYGNGNTNAELNSGSSRGRTGIPTTYPDVSAPGTVIRSTCTIVLPVCAGGPTISNPLIYIPEGSWEPFYASITGTSMAAPHVAGVAALLYQARPSLTPAEVEDVLQDTARKFTFGAAYEADPQNVGGTTSVDKGAGLVDVPAALNALDVDHERPPISTPLVRVDDPAVGETFEGLVPIAASGIAEDGTTQPVTPVPELLVAGDGGDLPAPGGADIDSLTVFEQPTGLRYDIKVRDILDVPTTASITLRVTQNVGGRPFLSSVILSATGVAPAAPGTGNTAVPTLATRDPVGSVVSFFVPFDRLGDPPGGTPAHNVFASSFIGLVVDVAPGPRPGVGADVIARPAFARPYTILRPQPVTPPTAEVRVSVDGGPEQAAALAGTSPSYAWSAVVDPTPLADGTHTLTARLILDGTLAASHTTSFSIVRPRVYQVLITSPTQGFTLPRAPFEIQGTSFTDDPSLAREVRIRVLGPGYDSGELIASGTETWSRTVDFSSPAAGPYTIVARLLVDGVPRAEHLVDATLAPPFGVVVSCAPRPLSFWRNQFNGSTSAVFLPSEASALAARAAEFSSGFFADGDAVRAALFAGNAGSPQGRTERQFAVLLLNLAAGELSPSMSTQVGLSGDEGLDGSVYNTGTIGATVDAATAWVRAQLEPGGNMGGANEVASAINNGVGLICS